jgi:glycosyltransferase involved in cell wall biosynthesis
MSPPQKRVVVTILDYPPILRKSWETYLLRFTAALNKRGWRSIFVFSGEPVPWFADELKNLDAPYFVANFPLTRTEYAKLYRTLKPYHPDVIHTHFLSTFNVWPYLLKLRLGAKVLIVNDHSSRTVTKKGLLEPLAWVRGKVFGAFIDKLIPVADHCARRDAERVYLPAHKIQRIYNGVEISRYQPIPRDKQNRPGLRISFAGQLIPEKGILTLLKAFRDLVTELPSDTEFLIAGAGHLEAELKEYCRTNMLTQVKFLGSINTVPQLFASSDIVVIPSEWAEACAFVPMEAMACGAAIVSSAAGGNPEIVGDAGLIFRKGDAQDLKQKLRLAINSPELRQQMGEKARERAVRIFNMERMLAEYLAIYDNI